MAAYAEYTDYTSYLTGMAEVIPAEEFEYWSKLASMQVDYFTYGNLKGNADLITSEVKECVCEIAELLYKAHGVSDGAPAPLASYSNDGESGTFDLSQSVYTESGVKQKAREIVTRYLGFTGLMYAGVR